MEVRAGFRPLRKLSLLSAIALCAIACMVANEWENDGSRGYFTGNPNQQNLAVISQAMESGDDSFLFCNQLYKTNNMSTPSLSLTAGIVTDQLQACQKFYSTHFGFKIIYESDWFVLLSTPGGTQQISFLQPGHPSQQPLFQPAFAGKGVYFTLEVDDVEAEYHRLKNAGIPILIELRKEPWGDTHFAIQDPAGVAVDIVTYQAPE